MTPEERKQQSKLRLLTSRLFTVRLRDDEFRSQFSASSGWTPQSPIIPCEAWTLFGEVRQIALRALEASPAQVAAIPVLIVDKNKPKGKPLQICVLTMGTQESEASEGSIELGAINPDVTMAQVCETLSPNKKWDVALLASEVDKGRFAGLY
jgi:hypothetical protein